MREEALVTDLESFGNLWDTLTPAQREAFYSDKGAHLSPWANLTNSERESAYNNWRRAYATCE